MFKQFLGSSTIIFSHLWGELKIISEEFTPAIDGDLVVIKGDPFNAERPLVRIHSECVFAEAFGSVLCDCADQMNIALSRIVEEGTGILFYLRLDGRGAGLSAKVKATALEVAGMDTYDSRIAIGVPPESRDFTSIGKYLISNNIKKIRLMTNNPSKIEPLVNMGIDVQILSLKVPNPNAEILKLYSTKVEKFGHIIDN